MQWNHQRLNEHRKLINIRGWDHWPHELWGWLEKHHEFWWWKIKIHPLKGRNQLHHKSTSHKNTVPHQQQLLHSKFFCNINWCCTTTKSIPYSYQIHRSCQSHCHSHNRYNFLSKKTTNDCCNTSWDWICTRMCTPSQRGWENDLEQILLQLISKNRAMCGQQICCIKHNLLCSKITIPKG